MLQPDSESLVIGIRCCFCNRRNPLTFPPMSKKELYRQFCKQQEDLPLFIQDWYLDAVCQDGEWDVALVEEGGKIVAALPFFVKRKWFARYVTMPVFTKYMGVYLTAEMQKLGEEHRLFPLLMEQLPQVDFFVQNFSPAVTNWLPFYWAGYRQMTRYTYVLPDLNDLELVFANIHPEYRRIIKKAEKELQLRSDLSLDNFFQVQKMTFDRQGLAMPFSFEQLKTLDFALAANQARRLLFACDAEDNIHAVVYLVWDKKRCYFHHAGENPAFRKSGSNQMLVWQAIQFASKDLGLKVFDFEGSMIKNVEFTRRRFGAIQQPYFTIWKNNAWWAKALNLRG